jgi:hypothetical protein
VATTVQSINNPAILILAVKVLATASVTMTALTTFLALAATVLCAVIADCPLPILMASVTVVAIAD